MKFFRTTDIPIIVKLLIQAGSQIEAESPVQAGSGFGANW